MLCGTARLVSQGTVENIYIENTENTENTKKTYIKNTENAENTYTKSTF
jgi:hypothetical protein